MKNLARHIELLLRDNDCVILPDFGGFIAYDVPAYYVSEEGAYYPPSRSISFNAAIKMNDGLLAQSYMKSYQVDYARANYMIEMAVEELLDTLDEEGTATLPHIGILKQDVHQTLQFTPEASGIDSPIHFGMGSLLIKTLAQLQQSTTEARQPQAFVTHTKKTINLHIDKSTLRHVLSTAAVFLLLLMMALPTGTHQTTDIASLRLTDIITSPLAPSQPIEAEEMEMPIEGVTTTVDTACTMDPAPSIAEPATPVIEEAPIAEEAQAITTEAVTEDETATEEVTVESPVAVAPQAIVEATPSKAYHIIVASLPSRRGADETLSQYTAKGYTNASIIERDDRVRISLTQFADKDEANEYLKTLRQNDEFQNAWLLAVRL